MKSERDYLLRRYHGVDNAGRRPPKRSRITQHDYLAIPIPPNLPVPVAGSCLIWRWALNRDGYGVIGNGGEQRLAHRTAYEQAHTYLPDEAHVLHLCHRPYCIQPAHLYLGTTRENVEDREARFGKLDPDILGPMPPGGIRALADRIRETGGDLLEYASARWEEASYSADAVWPDPDNSPVQLKLGPVSTDECPGHRFCIPAGDVNLCAVCQAPDRGPWAQAAPGADRNVTDTSDPAR